MPSDRPIHERWIPVAFGALDVRSTASMVPEAEILVAPTIPAPAVCLVGEAAELWRDLVQGGPASPLDLSPSQNDLLEQLADAGLVALGPAHPAAVTSLDAPSLSSPPHELVYALVHRVAAEAGIRCLFIKGPALFHQGLRTHEHSGDVDVWCDPDRWDDLAAALEPWGWARQPDPWRGTPIHHTATMTPTTWGCEIDVHRRLPGLTLADREAFAAVWNRTTRVRYAGVEVAVPDSSTHAVLAAVHAVRPEIGAGPRTERASALATALLSSAPDSLARATDVGALAVLDAELSAVSGTRIEISPQAKPHDWEWRGSRNRLHAYWTALQTLPPLTRFRVAARLLWPDDDVALASERRAGRSAKSASSARRRRLIRAAWSWARGRLHG
ncbi:nucleotidyltransferase family protein [Microbacterium sp. NPDC016588]